MSRCTPLRAVILWAVVATAAQAQVELQIPAIEATIAPPSGDLVASAPEAPPVIPAPPDPQFFLARGQAELSQGLVAQAIIDFDESIRLNPTNPLVYCLRGVANQRLDNKLRALGDLSEAILRDPQAPAPYRARAQVYSAMQRYNRAIEDYNVVLRMQPGDVAASMERDAAQAYASAPGQTQAAPPAPDESAPALVPPGTMTSNSPVTPGATALNLALEQAAIEEVKARIQAAIALQEKANLDAEMYRRQRVAPTPPKDGSTPKDPDLPALAAKEALQAQIEVSRALEEKAKLQAAQARIKWLKLLNPPKDKQEN